MCCFKQNLARGGDGVPGGGTAQAKTGRSTGETWGAGGGAGRWCFLWHLYHLGSQKETEGALTLGN